MLRAGKTVLVITLLTTAAMSQNASTSDQEAVQMLVQQVKDLQAKVKALEDERSAHAPEATANETTSEQGMPKEQNDHAALNELRGIQWRGFGEVNYKVLDQKKPELGTFGFVPGSAGNFYTGDFDLLLTSRINDRTSVLSEIVFGEGDAQSFNVDLERLLLKYDYNDHLRMSFGRYHTGIGYYNTAFHSGKWLQTTADRPLIMEFANDGGLLPTQAIGVSVNGLIPQESWV